ncbi:putative AC transposase, partial [Orchesella cincta]
MSTQHKKEHEEYKKYLGTGRAKRLRTIEFPVVSSISTEKARTDRVIMDYIVESMSALATTETDAFKKLVKGLNSSASPPTRKTLTGWAKNDFDRKKEKLKTILENVLWVCATADIWSARRKSFLGVTCHWIDQNYKRHSVLLSMKRFPGKHTADRIAELLVEVFSSYKLDNKITFVVTDNGSNFVKAFRDCQKELHLDLELDDLEEELFCENEELDENAIEAQDTFARLEEQSYASLPPHYRCVSHTLSLVATKDLDKELDLLKDKSASTCKKVMRSALAKCSAFWNKNGRSTQTAEAVTAILGRNLLSHGGTPHSTLSNFYLKNWSILTQHSNAAQIKKSLTAQEKEFLKEYNMALQPIAWSLDKLQGENCIVIKIYGLALKKGLTKRFEKILSLNIETARSEILSRNLRYFVAEANFWKKEVLGNSESEKSQDLKPADDFLEDLLDFDISDGQNTKIDLETQCLQYLQSNDRSLESLNIYPIVREMFFKFNTALPSSAPAERVFSYGGM